MAHGRITAKDLGIDIRKGGEKALFKWFIASFLFGKRIRQSVAERTYHVLVDEHGLDSPARFCRHSWQELVDLLGEGHYVRYDESTAERLLQICRTLRTAYGGRLGRLHAMSDRPDDLRDRLLAFKGVGPKTVEIFMREASRVWSR